MLFRSGTLRIWNRTSTLEALVDLSQQVTTLAISADGKLLATGGVINDRPAIVVRDIATNKMLGTLLGHEAAITCLKFNSDGKRLASGSVDKTARVWNLADPKFPELVCVTGHAASVTAVALNSDGTQILSGAADNTLKLWSVGESKELFNLSGHTGAIVAAAISPAGSEGRRAGKEW